MNIRATKWWRSDWFTGAVTVALFLLLWLATPLLRGLEDRAYDMGMRLTHLPPSERIAVIAIDQRSLDNLGRWPWNRDVHSRLLDQLQTVQPALIVSTVLLNEPQRDAGLDYLLKLKSQIASSAASYPAELQAELGGVVNALDVDQRLADSIARSGRVILPMLFSFGEEQGAPKVPDFIQNQEIEAEGNPAVGQPPAVRDPVWPLYALGKAALGVGSDSLQPDRDGVVRQVYLAMRHGDAIYPSFAALAAARAQGVTREKMRLQMGEALLLGKIRIATAPDASIRPVFQRQDANPPAFSVDSFFDVTSGKIALEKYRGKIVLIGATAPGLGAALTTPVEAATSPVLVTANALSAVLQQQYYTEPVWARWLPPIIMLVLALYLCLLLPRLKAGLAAALSGGLLLLLAGGELLLLTQYLLWLPLMTAALLLAVGHLALTTKRFWVTEARHEAASAASAASNRMLGLTFQGQGQLDLAFDKFRQVPLDDDMLEPLLSLALDFERKRQFNKAESVYRYMAAYKPDYPDLQEKLKRAQAMSEVVMLGGGSPHGAQLLADGSVEKPMLGRYRLERELGKGSMGVVYLGCDPKLSRDVAIKTMALSQEFDSSQIAEARNRFFREAEAAGSLNHPNIVTLYDAGEEHDLAYIAMEYIKGGSLETYAVPGKLLPIIEVMAIIRQVALALDFAHNKQVVHRDIKPANIMYDREHQKVKLTDFGVARMTDSSKTKTGLVLGTPSFMSPEQLAGKKIDGRSDLFSLGGALYQLVTGHLPFKGETLGELMYHIANDPPTDPRLLNPKIPIGLAAILAKAMHKNIELRFQTGAQFAATLARMEAALKAQKKPG